MNIQDFIGNPSVYAVQQDDGSYRPVREPLDGWADHLAGTRTLGTYVLQMDKARFMVFDDDTGDLGMAQQLKAAAGLRGLNAGVEFSGRKGYHVWVLFARWLPAADVQRLAKAIAADVGFTGEVFPKQTVARDLGNLVKLPGGVHRVTGQRSRFIGPEPALNTVGAFQAALDALPPAPVVSSSSTDSRPCLESIADQPPREGERHNLLFHVAGFMRYNGYPERFIEEVLVNLADAEFPEEELDEIIRDAQYPMCNALGPDRHCPDGECIKDRRGQVSPGNLKHAPDGSVVKVTIARRRTRDGRVDALDVEHPDGKGTIVLHGSDR